MHDAGHGAVPTVCIGGINAGNTAAVLAQSSAAPKKSLDGVAVVSALIAAADPAAAARDLAGKVAVAGIPLAIGAVARTTPLSHNMTNLVRHISLTFIGPFILTWPRSFKTLPPMSLWLLAPAQSWPTMARKPPTSPT